MADNKSKAKDNNNNNKDSNANKKSIPKSEAPVQAQSTASSTSKKTGGNDDKSKGKGKNNANTKNNGKGDDKPKFVKLGPDATPEEKAANYAEIEKSWATSPYPAVVELYKKLIALKTVSRPETKERDETFKKLDSKRDALRKESEDLKAKIENCKASNVDTQKSVDECRAEFNKVRDEQKKILEERSSLVTAQKELQDKITLLKGEENKYKTTKVLTPEQMERELERLEYAQQTSGYTLSAERSIIRQIEVLKSSRKNIEKLQTIKNELSLLTEKRKEVSSKLDKYKPSLDKYSELFTEKLDALKKAEAARESSGSSIPAMSTRRKEIHEELIAIDKKRQDAYNVWKVKEDEYYKCVREQKPVRDEIRKVIDEERKKEYEARKAAFEAKRLEEEKKRAEEKAAKEAEEAKKKPWEAEIAVCDYIIAYLEGLMGKTTSSSADLLLSLKSGQKSITSAKLPAPVEVKPSKIEGLKPMKPKSERIEESFIKITQSKKPQVTKQPPTNTSASTPVVEAATSSKQKQKLTPLSGPIIHPMEILKHFGRIDVIPPLSKDAIPKSINEVKEKRAYFDTLPRDAPRPTATKTVDVSSDGKQKVEESSTSELFPLLPGQKEPKIISMARLGPSAADMVKNNATIMTISSEDEERGADGEETIEQDTN